MAAFVLVVALVALVLWYSTRKPKGFPPGPFRAPLLGYATNIHPTKSHITYNHLRARYGDVVGIYLANDPMVIVSGWEAVTEALNNQDLNGRPYSVISLSNVDQPYAMRGVMFSTGEFWKTQRRFTLHHFRNLGFGKRTHQDLILEEVDELIKAITAQEGPFDIQSHLAVANVNILWAVLAGQRFDYEDESLKQMVKGIYDAFRAGQQSGGGLLFAFPFLRFVAPELLGYNLIKNAAQKVSRTVRNSIEEHRKSYDPTVCRDFIDIYLKQLMSEDRDASFTDDQLTTLCNDVMTAGSETGSSLVAYCILFLCLHPDWQEALHRELDEVLGACGERLPTIDDKQRLPKTEAFLSEIYRFRCPAPTTVPHTATRDTSLQGHRIPKGTNLLIALRSVMMDEQYWGDPQHFRPDRFITHEGKIRNYDRMIPFGKGKRACLGEPLARMTGFLVFAGLAARLTFRLPPGHPVPDTEGITGFTLGPPPFEVLVEKRTC